MGRPGWVPDDVDTSVPNAARVYDYALGGLHNFAVDRDFWHQAEAAMPQARLVAQANRAFLGRAVRWLVDAGVQQFLDIGSGIPTLGNVHEVAQDADPTARVMYVDIDPVAVQQSKALLAAGRNAAVIAGDLRHPEQILRHRDVRELLDFTRPVAVLMIAVLHFIPDSDDPATLIRRIGDALAPGSYIAISHVTQETSAGQREAQETVRKLYERTPTPVHMRTPEQLAALVSGLEIIEPGVVMATEWHPDPDVTDPPQPMAIALLARKP